ncbi:MAG: SURF1 family protein [Gammaproteobacteria bacterium]|nr:MAG: SURF1 family protein [Gammaproteobacteria bacterium]
MVALGFWQLHRADVKQALQEEYDARATGPAVRVEPRMQRAEDLRFYRVTVRGTYETANQIYIDNRVHQGRAGYHVVTPLRIEGSEVRLLVNRGWLPLGPDRAQLPPAPVPAGVQDVVGIATVPSDKPFRLGAEAMLRDDGQTLWQHMDLARFAGDVRYPVQPVLVLLDPDSAAGGLTREWSRLDAGIAVHHGYAFQWFMLAATLLAIYLFLGWRRRGAQAGDA